MQENNSNIKVLADAFLFIKKYFVLLIIFLIIGVLFGVFKGVNYSPKYKSYIIFSSGIIENIVAADMINALKPYLQHENNFLLSEKINLEPKIAESIIDISAKAYKEYPSKGFVVGMKTDSKTYFDTIAIALTNYLNNNEYCENNFNIYKAQRQEMVTVIDSILNNNKEVVSEGFAILFDKKIKYQQDLGMSFKINIVDKYIYDSDKKSMKRKFYVIYSLGSLSIGIIISLVIESIKKLIVFLTKKH